MGSRQLFVQRTRFHFLRIRNALDGEGLVLLQVVIKKVPGHHAIRRFRFKQIRYHTARGAGLF